MRSSQYAGVLGVGLTLLQWLVPDLPDPLRAPLWLVVGGLFVFPVLHSGHQKWTTWRRIGAAFVILFAVALLAAVTWPSDKKTASVAVESLLAQDDKNHQTGGATPAASPSAIRTRASNAKVSGHQPRTPVTTTTFSTAVVSTRDHTTGDRTSLVIDCERPVFNPETTGLWVLDLQRYQGPGLQRGDVLGIRNSGAVLECTLINYSSTPLVEVSVRLMVRYFKVATHKYANSDDTYVSCDDDTPMESVTDIKSVVLSGIDANGRARFYPFNIMSWSCVILNPDSVASVLLSGDTTRQTVPLTTSHRFTTVRGVSQAMLVEADRER